MTPEDLKQRSRRFVDEAWVQGDLTVIDELIAPDIVHHVAQMDPGPGRQAVKDFVSQIRSVLADMHVTYVNEVVEGTKAVRHITTEGTHVGDFLGVAPTHRRVTFDVVDIIRFDDAGLMVEHWSVVDLFSILQQLNAPDAS